MISKIALVDHFLAIQKIMELRKIHFDLICADSFSRIDEYKNYYEEILDDLIKNVQEDDEIVEYRVRGFNLLGESFFYDYNRIAGKRLLMCPHFSKELKKILRQQYRAAIKGERYLLLTEFYFFLFFCSLVYVFFMIFRVVVK